MILLSYTPQLFYFPKFRKNNNGLPPIEPMASGVLFTVQNKYFLVTAKHVFDDAGLNDIAIMGNNSVVNLGGELKYFVMPKEQDNIDLALIHLLPEIVTIISKSYSFLPFQSVGFSHKYSHTELYFCFGFINSQQKVRGKEVESKPFGFYTSFPQVKNYLSLGIVETENLPLRYQRRHQGLVGAKNRSHGPENLQGLSGGGVWHIIREEANPQLHHCSLVGIMIEQRLKRGMIIGTKIYLLAELLFQGFGILITYSH